MSEDTINDLKQFITATFSQQTAELRGDFVKLEQKVDNLTERFDNLETKVDSLESKFEGIDEKLDGFIEFVTDALDTSNEVNGEQLKNHEQRIVKLEQVAHV